jgi:hypothetical protein
MKQSENVAAMGLMTISIYSRWLQKMNQPDLVYKLIYLTTRTQSGHPRKRDLFFFLVEGISRYLDSALPKNMYRMRYEPENCIQGVKLMEKRSSEKLFCDLIQELIKCTTDKAWHVRESSCSGYYRSLFRHVSLWRKSYLLTKLWESCTRASGWNKESVRSARQEMYFPIQADISRKSIL